MRSILRIVLGACVAAGLAPAAQAGWLLYEAPDYGFAGLFPKTPTRREQTENDTTFTSFSAGNDGAVCMVVVAQYQHDIDASKEIAAIRGAFMKSMKATVTTNKQKTFSRGDAQLEAMEFEAANDHRSFRSLIVVDGQRAYQVAGGVSKVDGDPAELDACVGGFRLLPKG